MRRAYSCIVALLFILAAHGRAQERLYTVSASGTFTTSSKIFLNIGSADELTRNQFLPLDNLFGMSIDIRRQFEESSIQLGLNIEYISRTESYALPQSYNKSIPLIDGFTAIPVELSGYFTIPIGDEMIQLYMGGGGGLYFGERTYKIADVTAITVERNPGVGIHILSGIQYTLSPLFSLRSELKFRNVQFETINKFLQTTATYQGTSISLDQQPLDSRISINSMTVTLGLVARF